jgi:hypothetical protein
VPKISLTVQRNNYPLLRTHITEIEKEVPRLGQRWARESAQFFDDTYRDRLASQGRGGQPPPLSSVTRHLYRRLGEPNGSGIRNHIELTYNQQGNTFTATLGIPQGRPTIVAKVQDQGATIRVTPRMRGFLAMHGVFLKATTTHIQIPARHSWEYSLRDAREEAKRKLKNFWVDLQHQV